MRLERVLSVNGLLVGIVWCDGAQRTTHVGVQDLQSINVTGINPTKAIKAH